MPRAIWNGTVLAETDVFEEVDGNVYFPPESLEREFFQESAKTTVCGWKGTASYYSLVVDGQRNDDAAWVYRDPKSAAAKIKDHVAFWRGVTVER
ncbi:DUF427 domain-containing protein [Engelhardtia mirabilis]|uniref:DUF427 domain-containing protein n=1 Tax=Engelhardtia mirabilis TaxID=2528011 RepID=A0A518BQ35_9BACT|nr:hypothetical protein Pla133_41990 [Planctomycetes bacterium Pla133]QDV03410.1 hypothetical protein Pla86_41980 [Planctomycetes bacterium Pla86]